MKSNSFQKGFQLLHARGSMGVLLGAIWFFLAETGRKGDTPSSQNPMGGGCTRGGCTQFGKYLGREEEEESQDYTGLRLCRGGGAMASSPRKMDSVLIGVRNAAHYTGDVPHDHGEVTSSPAMLPHPHK